MGQYTLGLTQLLGHGRAFTELSSVPKPSVASGFTIRIGSPYWEMGDSLSFKLVTDSNAASRVVTLTVTNGTGEAIATVTANAALTASKTGLYTFLGNFNGSLGATDGPFLSPFPLIFLQPDFSVVITIGGVQVGDQVSNIQWYRQRYVTGSDGYLLGVVEDDSPAFQDAVTAAAVLA